MAPRLETELKWRIIPRFPLYEIREDGAVRRCDIDSCGRPPKFLKGKRKKPGSYISVWLHGPDGASWQRINRLVLETFVGPAPSAKHHAAHLDGSKDNNFVTNLEWKTPKQNWEDRRLQCW
jgi:hypothetical protein